MLLSCSSLRLKKGNTAFQHENFILSVKHGDSFVSSGLGRLAKLYQQILKENVRTAFLVCSFGTCVII
uniref:Uncharacterized protein n=1 Tax=Acanthochromis polyacanthus TaxID=80966 RepID=A0A3Q1FNY9_9TELE